MMLDDHEREQLSKVKQDNLQDTLQSREVDPEEEVRRALMEDQVTKVRERLIEHFGELWQFADIAHYHTTTGNCLFVATLVVATERLAANICFKVVEAHEYGYSFLSAMK